MRVFCTGISGVGATSYIRSVVDYAAERGKEIKVFDVGEEVFKLARESGHPVTNAGVLDLPLRAIKYLTSSVYKGIAGEIEKYPNAIVDGHINFKWRGVTRTVMDPNMARWINPDVYVNLMNLGRPIMAKLKKDKAQWRDQIDSGMLTLQMLLAWQNMEVTCTELFASGDNEKTMYVLPSTDSPDSLYKLATRKNPEVTYVSFPISHIKKDEVSKDIIDNFVAELRKFQDLAVISPRSVEMPKNPSAVEDQYTVMQDLEWFVEKTSKRIFACFPVRAYSKGVDHETIKAKESCKEVWFIAPKDMTDPFTNASLHRRFYKPEECIKALLESGMKQSDLRVSE
jgi:adenylate kinase